MILPDESIGIVVVGRIAWLSVQKTFSHDDQVQFEAVEPSHGALALCGPSLHRLVLFLALDVAGCQRRGVDDGDARALARGACLEEQQKVYAHLSLTLHETVVGEPEREFLAHMLAYIAQIEGFQVAEVAGVEQHEYRHDLAVRHEARTVAMALARHILCVSSTRVQNISEFVENTEIFY